jgi:hypothetical protein
MNAFQKGSEMNEYNHSITDGNRSILENFEALTPSSEGKYRIYQLKQNGEDVQFKIDGTIMSVELKKPIPPGGQATMELDFKAQIPIVIRRMGRNNEEGISYSMAQWYPKICEYDREGWHADPYVGREFYGVWGDFDVKINAHKKLKIAGTGVLQNADEIGFGYDKPDTKLNRICKKKRTWHFVAKNVHDFVWAADEDYIHTTAMSDSGVKLHFFYDPKTAIAKSWEILPRYMQKAFDYLESRYGAYPYSDFSFIQAGDGGMEYPMATLIKGKRSERGLVGLASHELIHSWFYGVLGNNELLHPWMDEGFTVYAEILMMSEFFPNVDEYNIEYFNPFSNVAKNYVRSLWLGVEEPLSTHSNHYRSNMGYSLGAYSKGGLFLWQLESIIGREAMDKGWLVYYDKWKFKHPGPKDFIEVMEEVSGIELNWYLEQWVEDVQKINYVITSVGEEDGKTIALIHKKGQAAMPLDIELKLTNGEVFKYHIPLSSMQQSKTMDSAFGYFRTLSPWKENKDHYKMILPGHISEFQQLTIDPTGRLVDVVLEDNIWVRQ